MHFFHRFCGVRMVLKDEILARTGRAENPANKMPEGNAHARNLNATLPMATFSKCLILRTREVLRRHTGINRAA